jgi:hypothetical protein
MSLPAATLNQGDIGAELAVRTGSRTVSHSSVRVAASLSPLFDLDVLAFLQFQSGSRYEELRSLQPAHPHLPRGVARFRREHAAIPVMDASIVSDLRHWRTHVGRYRMDDAADPGARAVARTRKDPPPGGIQAIHREAAGVDHLSQWSSGRLVPRRGEATRRIATFPALDPSRPKNDI